MSVTSSHEGAPDHPSDQRKQLLQYPVESAQQRTERRRNSNHDQRQILRRFPVGPCDFLQLGNRVEPLLLDLVDPGADRRSARNQRAAPAQPSAWAGAPPQPGSARMRCAVWRLTGVGCSSPVALSGPHSRLRLTEHFLGASHRGDAPVHPLRRSTTWQGRQDSNLQPAVLETAALPIELQP